MIIQDIPITLKNGANALIRSPKYEDIPDMLDFLYISSCETEFIVRCPEELSNNTVESQKALFDKMNGSDNAAMLVCLVEGKIAGTCRVCWPAERKIRHRASIAIVLLKAYWGQGIGTRMLQELIRIAEANENVLQMELDFVEGNTRARALYEKMGFKITGVRPRAMRLRDGTLLDEYEMVRVIKRDHER